MNFLTFGEIEPDDVKVYIKQNVYKALEKLSGSDTTKELGSIVLGEYCQEHGKTHVIISDYIEAKYTDASASTRTFSHETWDYVHAEHEKNYPDKKIIGWQHTHPNYGIFLSNYDMFIQENFFNLPFQIAYVIDPIQNLRGFFQWKNDKVEKLKGYYVYDDVGKPIKIEQTKVKKEESVVWDTTVQNGSVDDNADGIVQEAIEKLFDLSENGFLNSNGQATADDLLKMLENNEVNLPNKETLIAELNALPEKNPGNGAVTFKAYTVIAGDNLSEICAMNKINYAENYKIILAINGIENADQIYAGQTILLPVIG